MSTSFTVHRNYGTENSFKLWSRWYQGYMWIVLTATQACCHLRSHNERRSVGMQGTLWAFCGVLDARHGVCLPPASISGPTRHVTAINEAASGLPLTFSSLQYASISSGRPEPRWLQEYHPWSHTTSHKSISISHFQLLAASVLFTVMVKDHQWLRSHKMIVYNGRIACHNSLSFDF